MVKGWWLAIDHHVAMVKGWWLAIDHHGAMVKGWWLAIDTFFRRTLSRSFREKQTLHQFEALFRGRVLKPNKYHGFLPKTLGWL